MSKAIAKTLLLVSICLPGRSQTITASLEGNIKDPTGALIAGAQVRVTNTATQMVVVLATDGSGRFLAPSLPPGPYTITVEATGFKKAERGGITLEVNQSARLEITMVLGSATETVEVTAQAPLLDSSSSAMGQVVDNRNIVNMPLNQRNPYSLVFLSPGVVGSVGNLYNNVNISINGGRPGSTAMMVDGVPSSTPLSNPIQGFTVFPSVDAVQEFKVQSQNYSAEFGRSGGGIINLIYKSGTNELHGSLFEFLRNSKLDANNYFSNAAGVSLADFKRNQFGASAGGPVLLPRLYNGRNKTFFFFAYEGLRQSAAATMNTTMPTEPQRNGDFSQTRNANRATILIYDPATTTRSGSGFVRQVFPGNAIPAARFDPVTRNVLKYYPLPNGPGNPNSGANNFYVASASAANNNQFDIKIDENINLANRFFVRVSNRVWDPRPADFFPSEIRVAQGGVSNKDDFTNAAFDYTLTAGSSLVFGLRYGFGHTAERRIPTSLGFDPVQLGFPAYMREGSTILFPGFTLQGYATLGNGGASQWGKLGFDTHSLLASGMKVLTAHLLKFGFDWRVTRVNDITGANVGGGFSFTRNYTQGPNPTAASATAGDGFASFLLGTGTGTLARNSKNVASQSQYLAWYFADDWKATRRLTLNLGVRYAFEVPFTERYNRANLFDPFADSPLAGPAGLPGLKGGLVFLGVGGRNRRSFPIDWAGWDPRFGFAYQLAKNTLLRGGYGIFHAPSLRQATSTIGQTGFGSVTDFASAADGITPADYLRNPFPNGLVPELGSSAGLLTGIGIALNAHLVDDHAVPYTHSWSFNLQQQVRGIFIEGAYVGNRALHLTDGARPLNQLRPEQLALKDGLLQSVRNPFGGLITIGTLSGATVPYRSLLVAHPQFTGVSPVFPSGGNSIYHSFQFKLQKRLSYGLSLVVSYTAQKQIDDASITAVVGNDAPRQNIYDRRSERSISANDISQSLVIAGVYQLPFGRGRRLGGGWGRLADSFLGGWQVNGSVQVNTGYPIDLSTQNTSQSGNPGLRPNNDGHSAELSGPAGSRLDRFFDTSVFSQPAPYTFGNTGRVLPDVRTPGVRNIVFSLFKNFRVVERVSLQLRAEAFNLTNTPQFGRPNSNLNAVQFGSITSQENSPRQLQFGLKLLF